MPDLAPQSERLISDWYTQFAGTSSLGIPNTALVVLDRWRVQPALSGSDVLSSGGGQVSGLNGRNADQIIRRYWPEAPNVGVEAGRTSRATPAAAVQLAADLTAFAQAHALDTATRERLASHMQAWIVASPIKAFFQRQRIRPEISLHQSATANISALLVAARDRSLDGPVAQHLVGAKLRLRFPDMAVANHGYSTADQQTGRSGDFTVGDTVFHVTVAPAGLLIDKCHGNLNAGFRVTILVPETRRAGAIVLLETAGLSDRVEVLAIETFLAQNLEELGGFGSQGYRERLRELLEIYNARVGEAEADKSLLIEIPANL